jgi:hypothetical protein
MNINPDRIEEQIIATKRLLQAQLPNLEPIFAEVEDYIRQEVAAVRAQQENGQAVIPILEYKDVAAGTVSDEQIQTIKRRGAAIIRQVFPREQAEAWNDELGAYITDHGFYETENPNLDKYFSKLDAARPQIFGIYWSRPQMFARQAESMAKTKAFLNNLWISRRNGDIYFDPDRECTYADRTRRRVPGDSTLGLSPHTDAGSVERWLGDNYQKVYRHVFSGNWKAYDPFDGAYRVQAEEIPSPAVCSAFRSFQGWTALTPQGPGDGTLQLIPIAKGIVYILLRALRDDVPENILPGAEPCRALSASEEWHAPLLAGLCPIPNVEPGDTVWWHPDVVHAVEDEHHGKGYSNVIYIGAAPYCAKNTVYLEKQKRAFMAGESAPDFAAENYEVNYKDRATVADLSDLGKRQMGIINW